MKKSVKTKHLVTLLILLIVALIILLIFSFYPGIKSEEVKEAVGLDKYTTEEIIEPEEVILEETAEVPVVEETEEEIETINEAEIKIRNGRFYPDEIIISPGTTVTWINDDNVPHKVVAYDRLFYGNRLSPGDSYSFTFTNEGIHRYFDAVFPKLGKGEINVKEEPLPITGGVAGINSIEEENNAKFALVFFLFVVMIFALSHGIYKHHNE